MPYSLELLLLVSLPLLGGDVFAEDGPLNLSQATFASQRIRVSLPEGSFVASKINSSDLGDGSFSWSGKLKGRNGGFLSFARVRDYVNGSITLSGGIGHSFRGHVENLDFQSGFAHAKACGGCKFEKGQLPPDPRKAAQPLKSWRNGDANLIDLLVVYPSAVRSEAGSTAAVEAAIASAVADSNLCYRSSLVPMQIRVVHMAEVVYTPTGLLSTDLSRLKDPSDGSMDNVHTLRDQYGADLVCMLTTTSDAGGLASTMQHPSHNFESSGFNVNVWSQLGAPSYTLAHEIGHNMGCLHNREDSSWDSDYELSAFCFGKRWYQGGQGYRTVMSYDSNPASYGNRIPFFSNPNVSYLGTSVGNAGTEDNAQVLSITAPYVSNFRTSKVQAILPTVFDRVVTEGNSTSFKVRLTVQPVSSVNVTLSLSGDSDFFLSGPSSLTFDSTNWNIAQTVLVSAQADTDSANGTGTLTLSATGIPSATVQLSELDSGTNLESNFLVSGIVRNDLGMGLSGVSMTFSNGGPTLNSDANGSFRTIMNSGWSGTVTPSKAGYVFTPSVLTIGSLGANSTGHVFEANSSSILYVDKDATGAEDGTSWANAYVDLAQALVSQHSFNELWVAEGTYLPGVIKSTSFILPPNVQVYGGFAGNETTRTQRNAVTNPTILSGDIGTQANSSDNSYHVVVPSQGSTLDGFTVKDGNATKNFSNDDRGIGAGLYADEATFVVSNCIFMDNRSRQRGGAVYLKDCNATFVDCNFTNNKGTGWGNGLGYAGAIYASGGRLILQSTSFTGNSADLEGGAIFAENTDLNSTNCVFSGNQNTANNGGGAIRLDGGSFHDSNGTFTSNTSASSGGAINVSSVSGSVRNSSFSNNQAAFSGGAIRSLDSNFTSNHSIFSLNAATSSGGGAIDLENGSFHDANGSYSNNSAGLGGGAMRWTNTTGSIQDSNFTENQNPTSNGGGGFYLSNASPGFSNCRFTRNGTLANNYGGAVKMLGSSSSFSNCIFTRNYSQVNSGGAIYADGSSSPTFTNNEFRFNHSVQYGGAIFAESNLNFSGGLFLGNYANLGGGVATQGSVSCSFSNIRILGNEANSSGSSSGGFAYFNMGSTGSTFVNCVISGNKSLGRNGVYRPDGATRFVNCSIVGNQSAAEGGIALLFAGYSLSLDNSIMWGNTATTGNEIYVNAGTVSANYSLFNAAQSIGSISGSNNLNSDPLFSDADGADNVYGTEDDNVTLQAGSPAINAASALVANYPSTDFSGSIRSGNPDMGSYEFWSTPHPFTANGVNYEVVKVATNWVGASQIAVSAGGKLAEIKTAQQQTAIFNALGNAGINLSDTTAPDGGGGAYLWIGGNDFASEGSWVWDGDNDSVITPFWSGSSTGSPVNNHYNLWGTQSGQNEPDDFNGAQDALAISLDGWLFGSAGQWNDVGRENLLYFIVEYNAPPAFTSSSTVSIPENQANIVTVSATDANGDALSFSIAGGADQAKFSINAVTGALAFASPPDFENPTDSDLDNLYQVTVSASDGMLNENQVISVSVTDEQESAPNNPPSGLSTNGALVIDENQPVGTVVAEFNATDPDAGAVLTYHLVSGVGDGNNSLFTLDSNGTLKSAVTFDYESNASSYAIRVQAKDEFNATAEGNFTVLLQDVNESSPNNPPSGLSANGALVIDENQPVGTVVGEFNATDPDAGAVLTYHLVSGLGDGNNSLFTLETNGTLKSAVTFDYESNASSYAIRVQAKDEFNATAEGNFTVTLQDISDGPPNNPPSGLNSNGTLVINENEAVGKVVGSFTASDPDAGAVLTYHLVSGVGDGNNSLFTLESNGTLKSAVTFDYESNASSYSIRVQAKDEFNATAEGNFTVLLQDVNESVPNNPPTGLNSNGNLSILENQPVGTVVGEFNATDPDAGAVLTYHLVSGLGDGNNSLFTLESNGTLKSAVTFDYESNASSYAIRVQAKDEFNATAEGNFTVTLQDVSEGAPNNPPTGLSAIGALVINENEAVGTVVGSFTASDPDAGAVLTYHLVSGLGDGSNSLFTLESNGTLKSAVTFDYESNASSYAIRVQAKDEFNATAQGNFTVTLQDVSEGAPNNPPSGLSANGVLVIDENQPVGTVVGEFNATDPDAGAVLTYHLVSGVGDGNNSLFTLETNGTLKSAVTFDYESNASSYAIRVQAKDEFNATAEGNFTVTLQDVSEGPPNNPPTGLNSNGTLVINENEAVGTVVGSFTASDTDAGAVLTYFLVSGLGDGNNSLFTLESNGTLKSAVTFDYESNASSYGIRVQAKDEFNASVEGSFTVLLLNVHEGAPNDYRGVNISSLDLSGQDLSTALFDNITVFSSLFNGYRVGANLLATNAKLTGLSLQQTDFRGVNLAGVDLSNCILTIHLTSNSTNNQVSKLTALFDGTTIFSGIHPVTGDRVSANFSNFTGNGATLTGSYPGTDFRGVNLAGADLSESDLSQSLFDHTTVFSMVNPATGQSVGANLNGSNAQLDNLSFGSADFRGTKLAGVNFTRSDLRLALFDDATIFSAIDSSTSLRVGANFLATDANFSNLDLRQKDFRGVNLGGIDLSNTNLSSALFDHTTVFSGIDPLTTQRVGVDLSNTLGSGAVLSGSFPGANFGGVNLAGVNLSGSDLSQSSFDDKTVFSVHDLASGQNFGVNLTGSNAQLLNIVFGAVDLRGTQLAGVTFAGSDLSAALFDETTVFSALDPTTNQQVGVSLLATDANLTGLNFSQKDFRGVNLAGVNLKNANLTAAQLDHTTVFSGVDPGTLQRVGVNLSNLLGNSASLTGPFPGIEFRQVNLMGVHLEGADFSTSVMDSSTDLNQSTYDHTTKWPPGIDPAARGSIYTGPNRVPVFTSPTTVTIQENQVLSFDVNASDPDGNPLGYVIVGGSDELKFEINSSTGLLSFEMNSSAGMDFEVPVDADRDNVYLLTIGVSDGIELVDQNLSVIVTDVNEAPQNLNPLATLNIKENQAIGLFVGEFNASDQDAGATLSYALTSGVGGEGNGFFTLDGNGTLRTAQILNYESNSSRSILVRVTDDRGAYLDANFTVNVLDENDVPTNLVANAGLNINENESISSVVGEFSASDEDANASLVYELVRGAGDADNGLFLLETNGTLKTTAVFDFEKNASTYSLLVRVRDEHNASVDGNFSVNLLDVNEDPFNLVSIATLSVPENQISGFVVGDFNASDQDANTTLTYELTSGAGDAGNDMFSLDANGTLHTKQALNYELNASLAIRVRVKDEDNASVEATFTVLVTDLNDPPENLLEVSDLNFSENQPIGSIVGDFNASDQDVNTTLSYELANGSGDADNVFFTLDSNGTLRTATLFDFESNPSTYSLLVRVRDEHNASVEGNFSVNLLDVNEDPFNLHSLAILSVPENQSAVSFVGEFNASDQDANTTLTYELTSGAGDAGNDMFSLDANGTLHTKQALNYEANASLAIRVRVKDEHNASVEATFAVMVTDLNDPPENLVAVSDLNFSENQPVGSFVGDFNASDQDVNATLSYELANGSGDADNVFFTLDSNGTLRTATLFDFENNASTYSLLVRVRDEHNASAEGNFTVNLLNLNEAPYGLSYLSTLSVQENQPTGSFVGEFNASDYDANTSLSYSLQDGNGSGGNAYFSLDANGTLRTAVSLNYEKNPNFSIRVRVSDEFNEYIEGNFTVEVLDLNESGLPPAFDFNATALQVDENANLGTYVGRFTSFGGDTNASVSYALNQDPEGAYSKFSIDANGSLGTLVALNYEESAEWTLYVNASNDANESITNFFTVSVIDLNEAPFNLAAINSLSVLENQPIGSFVADFNATDEDFNATLIYELVSELADPGNGLFALDSNGTLRTATVFDFENNASSFVIRVSVTDEHNVSVEGNFTVNLLDLNEAPYGLSPISALSLTENQPAGSLVGVFNASDYDANGTLRYFLYDVNGTPGNDYFTLDENGTLRTRVSLDYESNASHLIRVRVYDESQNYAEGNFTVLVLDVREKETNRPPDGLNHQGALSIEENASVGTFVGRFGVTDPDGEVSFLYSLYDSNGTPGNAYFSLDANGTLRTAVGLDYETNAAHLIRVRVYDEFQAYAEGNFTVLVLDVNDTPSYPPFDFNASDLSVQENAPIGTYVGQFTSFGGEPNATVTFALNPDVAGAHNKFTIDGSGILRTLALLDYETTNQWTLNVTAANDYNESKNRSFGLSVINLYEAPVNYAPTDLTAPNGLVVKQLDSVGSVIGQFQVFDLNDSGFHAFELVSGDGDGDNALFSLDLNGTLRNASVLNYEQNKSLSIRVRVTDSWYLSYEKSFVVSYVAVEGASVDFISMGADVGGGWKKTDWFGYYFGSYYPWVFHENLGWLYVAQKSGDDVWLYHQRLGWVWTNKHVFAHMYVFKRSHWIFLDRRSWPAKLFDYSYMEWFELGRKYRISISMDPTVGGTISGSGEYHRWDPVRIEAVPQNGYLFKGWKGDLTGNDTVIELESTRDLQVTGSFLPDFSSAVPTVQAINALNELLQSLDHLTPEERQNAMAEILIDGKSSKAGIDLRGNDR